MRVLVVEDDDALAEIVVSGLTEHGIDARREATYAQGCERVVFGAFDVIVLDLLLPGGSGLDLCREIRRRKIDTPVLMLTARDTVADRVDGLNAGADDYLTKPFAFAELIARIHALSRRRPALIPESVRVADLEVNLRTRRARRGGRDIELTAKEFVLLEYLARHAGIVVDRAAISAHVWDENHDPFTNVLEVLVRRVRRKIDDPHPLKLIHTLRGAGYRLGV